MSDVYASAGKISIRTPTHHEVYYFKDGFIFLVDGVLFKIPSYMLERNSPVFRAMFSLPSGLEEAEGQTDANPIRLEQVTSIDFERLLAFFYPLTIEFQTFTDSWTGTEWTSILDLASRWEMSRARELAIQSLDAILSAVGKIKFGRKYDHPPWVLKGFTDLCLRAEPLTEVEACEMDVKDIVGCAAARERIRARIMELDNKIFTWTMTRHGSTQAREGMYEDGMKYRRNPLVEEIIEDALQVIHRR